MADWLIAFNDKMKDLMVSRTLTPVLEAFVNQKVAHLMYFFEEVAYF
jgi:hypothetical protein